MVQLSHGALIPGQQVSTRHSTTHYVPSTSYQVYSLRISVGNFSKAGVNSHPPIVPQWVDLVSGTQGTRYTKYLEVDKKWKKDKKEEQEKEEQEKDDDDDEEKEEEL